MVVIGAGNRGRGGTSDESPGSKFKSWKLENELELRVPS